MCSTWVLPGFCFCSTWVPVVLPLGFTISGFQLGSRPRVAHGSRSPGRWVRGGRIAREKEARKTSPGSLALELEPPSPTTARPTPPPLGPAAPRAGFRQVFGHEATPSPFGSSLLFYVQPHLCLRLVLVATCLLFCRHVLQQGLEGRRQLELLAASRRQGQGQRRLEVGGRRRLELGGRRRLELGGRRRRQAQGQTHPPPLRRQDAGRQDLPEVLGLR